MSGSNMGAGSGVEDSREQVCSERLHDVLGVLDPSGVSVVETSPGRWRVTWGVLAWRRPGGAVETSRLSVQGPDFEGEAQRTEALRLASSLKPGLVVRFQADVERATYLAGRRTVRAAGSPERNSDPELLGHALENRRTGNRRDTVLGQLRFNKADSEYMGNAKWGPYRVDLVLEVESESEYAQVLSHAHRFFGDQAVWWERVRSRLVEEYFPLKNESWLEEGEPPMEQEAFLERFVPVSVQIDADGAFCMYLDDGDAFWGHQIELMGCVDGGIDSAGLAG